MQNIIAPAISIVKRIPFPPKNIVVNKNGKPKDFPFLLLGGGDENRTRVQNDKKISFYADSHI